MLNSPLTKTEIYRNIEQLSLNKTPGIDGIPSEFYLENWNIISNDILALYNEVIDIGLLGQSQRRGIINLIPKSNDNMYIDSFRPLSLLCCDYKILAKTIAERIKKLLIKFIHNKQFCGVPGRSINQCNIELRDLIYYAKDTDKDLAVLNLDWYKAFDLVPIDFVFRILEKLGFGDIFVGWIRTLYNGIESTVVVNNILSDFFPITRSVRQGCPLSMSLFIIFQEPFYRCVEASRVIRPLSLPDSSEIKVLGFADDSNLLVLDMQSLVHIIDIVRDFENATGSKLNRHKTKIFGVGRVRTGGLRRSNSREGTYCNPHTRALTTRLSEHLI